MSDLDFSVYGMKLNPGAADPESEPFDFCKRESIVGVGWSLNNEKDYERIEEVYEHHKEVYERRTSQGKKGTRLNEDGRLTAAIRYILKGIEVGDYVWVNEQNHFALCKVTNDWRVAANLSGEKQKEYDRRDLQHFREVDWVDVPYSLVPGYVRRKFSGRFGALNRMNSGVTKESKQVIKALHSQGDLDSDSSFDRKQIAKKINRADTDRVFDILGASETEDIVISYLQSEGWRIIKSSTSNSQAEIECEMRKEEDGTSIAGYLQVKTGSASLSPESYTEYTRNGEMIFFVQSGLDVSNRDGISAINPETLHEYIGKEYNYLPNEPLLKLDFALN
ncbi:hypothetical protein [Halomicrococcus sp. SG-WS-1]|uniref:hypothetical protein n=1 Tax=Halomicrococcus sp. SG-WS-1 TaxID=3439057 RepID=UPI003F798533